MLAAIIKKKSTICATILLCLCLGPPAAFAFEPISAMVVVGLATYFAEKTVLDPLWDETFVTGEARMDILDERLRLLESSLRSIDYRYAQEIASFRKELSERTTPDQVRSIIKSSIADLEARVGKVEKRVSLVEEQIENLDTRVTRLEEAVFPGGARVVKNNGETFIAQADVFLFSQERPRQWRDKQNGPLKKGRMIRVSPDGVIVREYLADAHVDHLLKWNSLSALDQHYIDGAVQSSGWPVNGSWLQVKTR